MSDMTSKTHFSTLSIKTLNGAFEQPKMNHRRDFLRENKLSLRDLQKTTIEKLTQQQQEYENRKYKHIQKFHKTQEQNMGARRSASQSRNSEQNSIRQSRTTVRTVNGGSKLLRGGDEGGGSVKDKPNYLASRRAYSQQRHKVEQMQNAALCCCCKQQQENPPSRLTQCHDNVSRSASVSVLSKAESCDKEIQTEDINDEDFLYEALKKCSSSDIDHLQKQKSIDQFSSQINPHYEPDQASINSREQAPYLNPNQYSDNKFLHSELMPHTTRSEKSCRINGYKYDHRDNDMTNGHQEDLDHHFQNFKITDQMKNRHESQLSARSNQTLGSTSSKRSIHKLGSREDILLPRYLEKEKREKEEERLRELQKDLNCPEDHIVLSEEERLKALNTAQQKMVSLIKELNHMPMTMETLRIRKRKAEIEKELTQLEFDVRLYSKPKVYIPIITTDY